MNNTLPIEECDPMCDPRNTRVPAAGGFPSNTPPANSHTNKQRDYVGTDTLVLAYGVEFDSDRFNNLAERLDDLKAQAAAGQTVTLKIDGKDAVVRPTGAKLGKGGGPLMAWQVELDGFVVQFMRRHEPSGETPNVRVQVGALACLTLGGIEQIDNTARAAIESIGGRIKFDKVSRWDPFVDLEGVDVSEFVDAVREERIVTRSRKRSEFGIYAQGRKATGISLGAGISFRAYDKVQELKRDKVKAAAWAEIEWDGNVPEQCTRAEFELKREDLKSLDIDTVQDVIKKGGKGLRYLTTKWLRIASHDIDATHTTRVVVSALWQRVHLALVKWAPSSQAQQRRIHRSSFDVSHLLRMVRGCAESVAVVVGQQIHGFDDLVGLLNDQLYENQSCFGPSRYRAKLTLFEAAMPTTAIAEEAA